MSWQRFYMPFDFGFTEPRASVGAFSVNEKCFIRKEHKCGKVFGASMSCFIACPTQDDIEPILSLMSEKLMKSNIEPIIAVKERAYGQDIFCTKICGKIIESRFCLVILDDEVIDSKNIPNPNVYYEYGLLTSLRKHIIPLQKESLSLAFNIQSYDTVKYSPRNIASELDRAIRDAIRITEAHDHKSERVSLSEKALLRRLELAGMEEKDEKWFLAEVINDTNFKGFGHHAEGFYLYLGKIDNDEEFEEYLEDLSLVIYRTENKVKELEERRNKLIEKLERLSSQKERIAESSRVYGGFIRGSKEAPELHDDLSSILDLMQKIYIGFVINPQLDQKVFADKLSVIVEAHDRYEIALSDGLNIAFGDIRVALVSSGH